VSGYGILNDDMTVTVTDDYRASYASRLAQLKREVVGDYIVSSVFLQLDHALGGPIPVHFECYVFKQKDGEISDWGEVWGERASYFDDLMKIHDEAVSRIKAGTLLDDGPLSGDHHDNG